MKGKLIGAFTKNLSLKLLSLFFAVVLWLVVVNVDDPNQSRNFSVQVQLLNEDLLTSAGKYYSVTNGSGSISFRATAKRSIIERLTSADFTATADLRYMEDSGRVPVEISPNRFTSQITISSRYYYLDLTVGEKQESKFIIQGRSEGEPAEGYVVERVSVSPNVLVVSGPADIVSQIDSVEAAADVTGLNTDVTESVVPRLLDKDGKDVNATELTMNLTTVNVSVTMSSVQAINITVEQGGKLADGLELDSITCTPQTVELRGNARRLNNLQSIVIPESVIDLSEITENTEVVVDITPYIPTGLSLADASKSKVKVWVRLKQETSRVFTVPCANLNVRNLAKDLESEFGQPEVEVEISGFEDALSRLSGENITGTVDAAGLGEGEHRLQVSFNLESGQKAENASVLVVIRRAENADTKDKVQGRSRTEPEEAHTEEDKEDKEGKEGEEDGEDGKNGDGEDDAGGEETDDDASGSGEARGSGEEEQAGTGQEETGEQQEDGESDS